MTHLSNYVRDAVRTESVPRFTHMRVPIDIDDEEGDNWGDAKG